MRIPTALSAKHLNGEKLYQQRAKLALPILVKQAKSQNPIYYSDLAKELKMPNPRNLNYVLGCIGNSLLDLSEEWNQQIPLIQTLVINKNNNAPGDGISEFFPNIDFNALPKHEQRAILDTILTETYLYKKWDEVLISLGLSPLTEKFGDTVMKASQFKGGGESESHKSLKEYVRDHPNLVGFRKAEHSSIEYPLPSGDSIDVYFENKKNAMGVEVKSHISPISDIVRGLFQTIKYQSILVAKNDLLEQNKSIQTILVVETKLPEEIVNMANRLGVEVKQILKPKSP